MGSSWVVGGDWNMTGLWLSHHIGNVIIPTDFHSIIFQRGRLNHQPDGIREEFSWDWGSNGFERNICRKLAPFCSIYWLTRYMIHVKPNNWTHSTFTGTNHKSPVFGWWNLLNSDSLIQEIPSALACFEDLGHFGVPQKLEPQHFVYHQFPQWGIPPFEIG